MQRVIINKQGSELRAVQCPKCKKQIIHPADLNAVENFKNLKDKTYNVKLRLVGNSHAISIPKEIVEFMRHQERMMDDMVRLCFEDMHHLSLNFGKEDDEEENEEKEYESEKEKTYQKIDADARFLDARSANQTALRHNSRNKWRLH